MTTIYTQWNAGLGDTWASVNLLLHKASMTNEPIILSRFQNGQDMGPLQEEIGAVLDQQNHLALSTEPGNAPLDGYTVWRTDYFPTIKRWRSDRPHAHAVCCFESASTPELKDPSAHDLSALTEIIHATGLPCYRLGKHLGVRKCIELAASAAFFVGSDTGPSHICHSVGVPMFLLEYKLGLETCHRGKGYTRCEGAEDFRIKLGRWRDYRTFIGAGW